MLKITYTCPLCNSNMQVISKHDGVKILKCESCKCEIHFGSWEQQNKFAGTDE